MTEHRRMVPVSSPVPAFARVRTPKSASAFRTISEVADQLDVPQHVLRFWETRFTQIRPLKRAGGRRYYRPEDVDLLRRIRELLYRDGYTIKGVQKLLRDSGRDAGDVVEGGHDAEIVADEPGIGDKAQSPSAVTAEVNAIAGNEARPSRSDAALRLSLDTLIAELEAIRSELDQLRGGR